MPPGMDQDADNTREEDMERWCDVMSSTQEVAGYNSRIDDGQNPFQAKPRCRWLTLQRGLVLLIERFEAERHVIMPC